MLWSSIQIGVPWRVFETVRSGIGLHFWKLGASETPFFISQTTTHILNPVQNRPVVLYGTKNRIKKIYPQQNIKNRYVQKVCAMCTELSARISYQCVFWAWGLKYLYLSVKLRHLAVEWQHTSNRTPALPILPSKQKEQKKKTKKVRLFFFYFFLFIFLSLKFS